jgi:hypothetical protein
MKATDIRCLCGDIRVRVVGEPAMQFYCHCDDCQAVHGAAYIGVAVFPSEAVTIEQGEPTLYTYKTLPRARCGKCGTMLFAHVPASNLAGVKANLLPAGTFEPAFHIHCRYAVLPVIDDLPHYKSLPKVFGGTDELIGW